jgi:hypothetical protein
MLILNHIASTCDGCAPAVLAPAVQLRSLDVSGTEAGDCLLLWLAQRSCCRLQKLTLSGSLVTGLGVSALLAAKRALLHHQRCPATAQALTAQAKILPLLELSAGGTAAFAVAGQQHLPPWDLVEASQVSRGSDSLIQCVTSSCVLPAIAA